MIFSNWRYLSGKAAAVVTAVAVAVSCSDFLPDTIPGRDDDEADIEVEIAVPQMSTRTVIDSDDNLTSMTMKWADGDRIALWAQGYTAFSAVEFTHTNHFNDPGQELFKGRVPRMEAGTYKYYALYPAGGVEISDQGVSIEIPSVQNGDYDPDLDIMSASAEGEQLTTQFLNQLNLNFRHLTHVLKICVPDNPFGDNPITRMRIEFPTQVVGKLRFGENLADDPTLEDGTNTVTLELATPKYSGDYIWVFLAPANLTDGKVTFTATDGKDFTYPASTTDFRTLQANHITPVDLGLRLHEVSDELYIITVDKTNLGEDVTTLHSFSLPEGFFFPTLEMSNTATAEDFESLGEGRFGIHMFKEEVASLNELEGRSITMVVESERTIAQEWTTTIYDSTPEGFTVASPFLFFEDFSQVPTFHSDDNHKSGNEGTKDACDPFLGGWTGGRIGAEAGTSIRIAAYRSNVLWAFEGSYPARADSAPMSNLKNGVTVSVKLTVDYGMNEDRNSSSAKWVAQTIYIGRVDNSAGLASDSTEGTYPHEFSLDERTASWTNLTHRDQEFIIENVRNISRMSFRGVAASGSGNSNNTCWLYIDNVRVSIAE